MEARESEIAIAASAVVCQLGKRPVLDGVSLAVAPGEIHAVLGPNGAGKTTLIRLLCGLVEPREGSVRTTGTVALVPSSDRSFYMRLSMLENLIFFGRLNGLRLRAARNRAYEVLEDVGLRDVADRPAGRCSHGMQKRLSVARALLVKPTVLLVDEATHDLDPEGAQRTRALVGRLAGDGTAVLWTTQRVEEIRGFADSVTFLSSGRVRFAGSPHAFAELARNERYVVRVRSRHAGVPTCAALQLALGRSATVGEVRGEGEHFLLALQDDVAFGAAVTRLTHAGYEILSCRQEQAEIEDAFLLLAAGAAA